MPDPDPSAEWWTIQEVAAFIGVVPGTVSAYLHEGRMPDPERRVGQSPIWRPAAIVEWQSTRPGRGRRKA